MKGAGQRLDRLMALVRRELGAEDVRVLEPHEEESSAANVLVARLGDGRRLSVAFADAPAKREVLERRLSMLTATFAQSLEEEPHSAPRLSPEQLLRQELRALAVRARAVDAAVIDAHSPVLWGAGSKGVEKTDDALADTDEALALVDMSTARLAEAPSSASALDDESTEVQAADTAEADAHAQQLVDQAVEIVRGLPVLADLRKGHHLDKLVEAPEFLALVKSFASIYLLIVVFEGPFDEVRADRAVEDALPRIERLVLALPPLDPKPAPIAGVISLRRGRRR